MASASAGVASRTCGAVPMPPNYQVQRPGTALKHAGAPAPAGRERSAARGRALYGWPARCNAELGGAAALLKSRELPFSSRAKGKASGHAHKQCSTPPEREYQLSRVGLPLAGFAILALAAPELPQ